MGTFSIWHWLIVLGLIALVVLSYRWLSKYHPKILAGLASVAVFIVFFVLFMSDGFKRWTERTFFGSNLDQTLAKEVSDIQGQVPIQIDEVTTLTSVAHSGGVIVYRYRINVTKSDVDLNMFKNEIVMLTEENSCGLKASRFLLSKGAILHYVYFDANDRILGEHEVTSETCADK